MSLFSPTHKGLPTANHIGFPRHLPYHDGQLGVYPISDMPIQDGAPKIAKLVSKWFNYGLW